MIKNYRPKTAYFLFDKLRVYQYRRPHIIYISNVIGNLVEHFEMAHDVLITKFIVITIPHITNSVVATCA